MDPVEKLIQRLASLRHFSYHADSPAAGESTALAAMALLANQKEPPAQSALDQLCKTQRPDGSVPAVCLSSPSVPSDSPGWPTGFAVVAWTLFHKYRQFHGERRYATAVDSATKWILATEGTTTKRSENIGHDTTLPGWPWAIGTHSWLEPTAIQVLGLRANHLSDHPRTRTAIRLMVDRLLPADADGVGGGCNYGNTTVLGQQLLPHVQPTGLVLLAIAKCGEQDGRISASLDYLAANVRPELAPTSLSWALMALAAHGRWQNKYSDWIELAVRRQEDEPPQPHVWALLVLAATANECPLIPAAT